VTAAGLRLKGHLWPTLKLAGPVVVARSGVLIMMTVDTAMTGSAGAEELAWFGIGLSPTIALTLLGLGFLLGVTILTSQAEGAGESERTGVIWKTGLWHAIPMGVLFAVICLFGEELLLLIGQSPELSAGGGRVMQLLGYGMPGVMIFVTCSFFLEGLSRPLPGMLIMLAANIVNFALNWLLIHGNGGFEPMGAEGAAIATTIARTMTAVVILVYIWWMRDGQRYGVRTARSSRDAGRRMRRLGYPMGLAMFVEVAAFMAMTQFAGFLGNDGLAGYQIAHNLVALVFMSAIGLGAATSVRVGNAVGRGDRTDVQGAAAAGILLVVVVMAALGSLFLLIPGTLVSVYSSGQAVAAFALPALAVAGTMMVFDGAQAVMVNALRSMGDVWFPMAAQILAFWLLASPVAWYLAFEAGYGTAGLMGGIYAGVVIASILNGWRIIVVTGRPIARS
jgi:MATE family multidrug resistance protein